MSDPLNGVISFLTGLRDDRRLLRLIFESVQRLELAVSAATEYVSAALDSLDVQMTNLQVRLTEESAALLAAIAGAALGVEDEAALTAAADRIQATAVLVNTLVQPSAAANPDTADVADPLV